LLANEFADQILHPGTNQGDELAGSTGSCGLAERAGLDRDIVQVDVAQGSVTAGGYGLISGDSV
jgi:hypothetical protein